MRNFNRLLFTALPIAALGATACGPDEPNQEFSVSGIEAVATTSVYYWDNGEGDLPWSGNYRVLGQEVRIECVDKSEDEQNFFGFYDGDDGCDDVCSGYFGTDCRADEYTYYWFTKRRDNPDRVLTHNQSAETAGFESLTLQPVAGEPIPAGQENNWSVEQNLNLTATLTDAEGKTYTCSVNGMENTDNTAKFRQLSVGEAAVGREKISGTDPNWIEFTAMDRSVRVDCL